MTKKEVLKKFSRTGTIVSASIVDGRGDDKTIYVMMSFGGTAQGFTGFFFGEDRTAEMKLSQFCKDLAAAFGKNSLGELVGLTAVALYNKQLVGGWGNSPIVGLMSLETGTKFIAKKWFEQNYGIEHESVFEEQKASLLREKERLSRRVIEIDRELDNLENDLYEW